MCKGLALLANYDEIIYNENNSHHSQVEGTSKIDSYCKIEIIRDDTTKQGYRIELDEQIDDNTKELWVSKQFITSKDKIHPKLLKKIQHWCNEHELEIWKSFARGCSTYATIKGDNYQSRSTIEGDNYQSGSTIKGNNDQSWSTIKGNNYQYGSTIKGGNYQSESTIKGDNYQSRSTIEGDNYQSGSTIEGDNYQSGSTIKGNNDQSRSIIKGNNYQSGSTIKGNTYLGEQTHTKYKKLTKIIEQAGNELHKGEERKLTLHDLLHYISKKKVKY